MSSLAANFTSSNTDWQFWAVLTLGLYLCLALWAISSAGPPSGGEADA